MTLADDPSFSALLKLAVAEDLGAGDLSSACLPGKDENARFSLVAREPIVFAGAEIAQPVLAAYDENLAITWASADPDGARFGANETIASIEGPLGLCLSAERVLLNFLQKLSGIAALTAEFVKQTEGTRANIFDTRKTTPGWRALEKYAVRCGGGRNHRMGLHDAVLIKDNHLAGVPDDRLAGSLFHMLSSVMGLDPKPAFIEVEVDTFEQFEEVLKVTGIDIVLLDNFTPFDLKHAVELRDALGLGERLQLEASGGITIETIREFAETGVERISVGAITHSARFVDLSLERA